MNDKNHLKCVPGYGNDTLSDILHLLKLNVDIYHNAKVCGKWRIDEHNPGITCFHIVTLGSCILNVPDHFYGVLECGDLVIFPRELNHCMQARTSLKGEQQHLSFEESGDREGTGLLCAEVRFQHEGCRLLLDALPPVFIIRFDKAGAWLKSLLNMIMDENQETGLASKVILDKLSELLFTYALKQYLLDNPNGVGILSLYSHSRIAKAVSALHKSPEKNWTLESLANEAMLSRTVFAQTFKTISGWTAGHYLTWWRMQIAWSLLKNGENITQVSAKVGYQSESSFSRAFKNMFAISAGKVRKIEQK